MSNNEIRQCILDTAVRIYVERNESARKSIDYTASRIHGYPARCGRISEPFELFILRFYDYFLGDDNALTASEITTVSDFYRDTPCKAEYSEFVWAMFKAEIRKHKANIEYLTAATSDQRQRLKGCYPCPILDRIGNYIKSFQTCLYGKGVSVLYASIYHIGYTDGIRDERTRRKKATAKAEEVTAQ